MLLSFDASQVRKICQDCKKFLDYLVISETIEDLVQFVKNLSPCLSKVSQDVEARLLDLLNPQQRESLRLHLEQIKTLAPMMMFNENLYPDPESARNRN